ncbi:uncharacterized protein LOC118419108 [Branchiostoma floridae]|uniref:Uncharacterized protein LOC118419108 n=1 Tax=Branchiostoma floridae TaxID=7739 RepID=A0A9J7MWM8_BRAFL|nr:uncharacterized protein LOC118419108 [Branchiostoma floridae]
MGHAICPMAWCRLYGISRSRFYEVKSEYERGRYPDFRDGRQAMEYPTSRYLTAKEWMLQYAKKYGESMPNSSDVNLPQCVRKNDVFKHYEEDHWYENALKRSRFMNVEERVSTCQDSCKKPVYQM